jgi:hypothetical protein
VVNSTIKLPKAANPANLEPGVMEQFPYPNVNLAQQDMLLLPFRARCVQLAKKVPSQWTALPALLALLEPLLKVESLNVPHAQQDTCLLSLLKLVTPVLQQLMKWTEQLVKNVPQDSLLNQDQRMNLIVLLANLDVLYLQA